MRGPGDGCDSGDYLYIIDYCATTHRPTLVISFCYLRITILITNIALFLQFNSKSLPLHLQRNIYYSSRPLQDMSHAKLTCPTGTGRRSDYYLVEYSCREIFVLYCSGQGSGWGSDFIFGFSLLGKGGFVTLPNKIENSQAKEIRFYLFLKEDGLAGTSKCLRGWWTGQSVVHARGNARE